MNREDILLAIDAYYSEKLAKYGTSAKGVDWNSEQSQQLRFEQLCKILPAASSAFSINDLGCGYGAMLDHLKDIRSVFLYSGYDISEPMIEAARTRHQNTINCVFSVSSVPTQTADFCTASGIFNVRLDTNNTEWERYIVATLDAMDATSARGFAFNCLTSYSDHDKMRQHLYYADPCKIFDFCKRKYSRDVALLHDYGLYEFTILVRKSAR